MKRSLAIIASAAALAGVMIVPSRASAQVSIYVGPGYPAYGYGYGYYRPYYGYYGYYRPYYGYYGYYRPYYGYGYRRPYYGYARRHWRRHWRRWH